MSFTTAVQAKVHCARALKTTISPASVITKNNDNNFTSKQKSLKKACDHEINTRYPVKKSRNKLYKSRQPLPVVKNGERIS